MQVHLTPELAIELKRLAAILGCDVDSLVQEAMARYIKDEMGVAELTEAIRDGKVRARLDHMIGR